MSWGALFFVIAGLIQFALSVDILGGDIDWDRVTAGFVLFGIAFAGVAFVLPMVIRRNEGA